MCQVINITDEERKTLQTMWTINNILANKGTITADQKAFFNKHLEQTKLYYKKNFYYWDLQLKAR